MLMLNRRERQEIVIGEDIIVTVVEIGSGFVRLGIDAPSDVDVWREELCRESWPGKKIERKEE